MLSLLVDREGRTGAALQMIPTCRGTASSCSKIPGPLRVQGSHHTLSNYRKLIVFSGKEEALDLAMKSQVEFSLEEAAFFILQGRSLCVGEEQGCFNRERSQEPKIAPLTMHSPTAPEQGPGAVATEPKKVSGKSSPLHI